MKAIWNNQVIAESQQTVVVDNNHYFPQSDIYQDFFVPSDTKTVCSWKGEASYYTLSVDGQENKDAAWYYSQPKAAAENIKGHIAFWKGVAIER